MSLWYVRVICMRKLGDLCMTRRNGGVVEKFSTSVSRISSRNVNFDINLCATNPELIVSHLRARGDATSLESNVHKVAELRSIRNNEIARNNDAKRRRHVLSDQIGRLVIKKNTLETDTECASVECGELKKEVEGLNDLIRESDKQIHSLNEDIKTHFMELPNLIHDSVPEGREENDNVILFEWGSNSRKVGDNFRWHDDIALTLGGLDLPAAVRMSGSRFSILKGQLARLERALTNYFLDYFTGLDDGKRYEEVAVPFVVTRSTLESTGQLPKFEDDLFKVNHDLHDEEAYLIPTGEVPLTCLQKGQIISVNDLPLKYVCNSPCFRAEAGSRGRDTRGLLRQHQFQKTEIVKICSPEDAEAEYEDMLKDVEILLQQLELPFRTVLLNSSDLGFSASLCHDFEVWFPGQQQFREISSVSNCGDFQSRRMGMRYRVDTHNMKNSRVSVFPHTMNGSGLAVGRTLAAILENFQNTDGSVDIPPILHPYMNGTIKLVPPTVG